MTNTGYHLAIDLFTEAAKRKDQTRFWIPIEDTYQKITWQEYADKIKSVAGYLLESGLKPGDKVAVLGNNSYNWCVLHLAIESIRGVLVPIYPASTPEMITYFLAHSEASLLFCDGSFLPKIETLDLASVKEVIVLEEDFANSTKKSFGEISNLGKNNIAEVENRLKEVKTEDIATIIYTSGTTGLPKGVMLTHANLEASITDWISLNAPYIPDQAVDLHWLPLSHTFGSGAIMLGNRLGWQSYFVSHKDLIAKLPELKPHLLLSVPAYWEKIYNLIQEAEGDSLKEKFDQVTGGRLIFGLSGGAGLKKEIKEGFYQNDFLIIEGYGLTECSPTLTMNRRDKFDFDTVGVPFPSVQVKLEEDGEILAKGPNIFSGYYKDEKATKEAFTEDGWFKTGDVGQWTESGFLKIIDRKKEILVTSGGKNVPPQNIERLFQDNIYINHFVVYGDGKKYLSGLVTLNEEPIRRFVDDNNTPWSELLKSDGINKLVQEQIDQINQLLPSYETIKKFYLCPNQLTVEENLLTASLKIRRKAIYQKYHTELENLYQ